MTQIGAVRIVSVPSSTTASTAPSTTSAAAAETPAAAFTLRPCLVNVQCSTTNLSSVYALDCTIPFRIIGHFDERKTTGLAAVPVCDDVHTIHGTVCFEQRTDVLLGGLETEIPYEYVLHLFSF